LHEFTDAQPKGIETDKSFGIRLAVDIIVLERGVGFTVQGVV
jgi:hypothetical protein